jgi:hypothetical protein
MKKGSYSHQEFIEKVAKVNPDIKILSDYLGMDHQVMIECKHQGTTNVYAYRLLKPNRHCCKQGYYESKKGKNKKTIEERIDLYQHKVDHNISFEHVFLLDDQKLHHLFCQTHNMYFDQWFDSLRRGIACPECGKENKRKAGIRMLGVARKHQVNKGKAKFISKAETLWLDSLSIPIRQHWLEDVQYSVDGFDPSTNTVYLYHGRFWHGCLETYDPEMIHPILKVKMKQLFERTMEWEHKILGAGYNLVTKWGK